MWALNGDHISRIYAGTGALGGGRSKVRIGLFLFVYGVHYETSAFIKTRHLVPSLFWEDNG